MKVKKRKTEYWLLFMDENEDILDCHEFDTINKARANASRVIFDEDVRFVSIEIRKKVWEADLELVKECLKKYGKEGRNHPDCNWELIGQESEIRETYFPNSSETTKSPETAIKPEFHLDPPDGE